MTTCAYDFLQLQREFIFWSNPHFRLVCHLFPARQNRLLQRQRRREYAKVLLCGFIEFTRQEHTRLASPPWPQTSSVASDRTGSASCSHALSRWERSAAHPRHTPVTLYLTDRTRPLPSLSHFHHQYLFNIYISIINSKNIVDVYIDSQIPEKNVQILKTTSKGKSRVAGNRTCFSSRRATGKNVHARADVVSFLIAAQSDGEEEPLCSRGLPRGPRLPASGLVQHHGRPHPHRHIRGL